MAASECGMIRGERSERGKTCPASQKAVRKAVFGAMVKTTAARVRAARRASAEPMSAAP
jgi:hypothetical protein